MGNSLWFVPTRSTIAKGRETVTYKKDADLKLLPPVEVLRELYDYDPQTGVLSYKKHQHKSRVGKQAGHQTANGRYLCVKHKGKVYSLHRLIYKWVTGEDPVGYVIDHIDRNSFNNSWNNLRKCTQYDNSGNRTDRQICDNVTCPVCGSRIYLN